MIDMTQVDCQPPGPIVVRVLNNPIISLQLELAILSVAGSGVIKSVDIKNSLQVREEDILPSTGL